MWSRCVVGLAFLVALAPASQAQFVTFRSAALASNSGRTPTGIAVGDFDEDGALDVATSNSSNGTVTIFLPWFGELFADHDEAVGSVPTAILAGDCDADGHVDLVVASGNAGTVVTLKGTGDGNFDPPGTPANVGANPTGLAWGDFDGDGEPDLAVANEGQSEGAQGSVTVLLGNGDCTFNSVATMNAGIGTRAVAVADVNRDGHADVLAVNGRSATCSVFLNDGDGESFSSAGSFATGPEPSGVAVGELSGDGVPDAVIGERNADTVSLFVGNGAGGFTLAETQPVGTAPSAVAVGDIDGDGVLDAVVTNDLSVDVSVLLGDGAGGLSEARSFVADGQPAALALADFDGDGTTAVLTANVVGDGGSVAVLRNRGSGSLEAVEDVRTSMGPSGVSIGDLNDDALPDVVVAHESGTVLVLLAEAGGAFHASQTMALGGQPRRATLARLNADDRLDLAAVDNAEDRILVMLGKGDGTFGSALEVPVGAGPASLASGDFDGDGVNDLAASVSGPPGQVAVLRGKGDGTFEDPCTIEVGETPVDIVARNLDALNGAPADRKDDIVVVNHGSATVSVLKSIDGCAFSVVTLTDLGAPATVAVGLFDADMNPDLAVGNAVPSQTKPSIQIFKGNGDGTFTRALSARGNRVDAMVVRDFTGDGVADLAMVDETLNLLQLLRGRGDGGFSFESEANVSRMPVSMTAADFDGDGRYDAATANSQATANNMSVLTNCVGDEWCLDAPKPTVRRGDGNGDDEVSAADFVALVRELADADGKQVEDVARAGFVAVAGVDANGDGRVDKQDAGAVVLRVFAGG